MTSSNHMWWPGNITVTENIILMFLFRIFLDVYMMRYLFLCLCHWTMNCALHLSFSVPIYLTANINLPPSTFVSVSISFFNEYDMRLFLIILESIIKWRYSSFLTYILGSISLDFLMGIVIQGSNKFPFLSFGPYKVFIEVICFRWHW